MTASKDLLGEEHLIFRDSVRRFIAAEVAPHYRTWEERQEIPRAFWIMAGEAGLLCPGVPEEYGGVGADYLFSAIIAEEIMRGGFAGLSGLLVHSDVVAPYLVKFGTEEQKRRWLPPMVAGEIVTSIGMTEPDAGSDLQAITTYAEKRGDDYLITGQKTYITNSYFGDAVLMAVKTDRAQGAHGTSLFFVETNRDGFRRGKKTRKMGLHTMDQTELYLEGVRVPATNLIGVEGQGFAYMMENLAQERMAIAVGCLAHAEAAFEWTVTFTKDRKAFKGTVFDFQNTRFRLAEIKTELTIGRAFLDSCLARHVDGELDATTAAMAKYWLSELEGRVMDQCLQLHGGAGYMWEYPIAHAYVDARATRIYGGTNEVMKLIIARSI